MGRTTLARPASGYLGGGFDVGGKDLCAFGGDGGTRGDLRAAAQHMRDHAVGSPVVVDGKNRPVGVLTDRDLMLRCVAEVDDADLVQVAQAMSTPVVTAEETMPIENILSQMSASGVRRVPVADGGGTLVGILALDDVLDLLSEEVTTIGRLLSRRAPKV